MGISLDYLLVVTLRAVGVIALTALFLSTPVSAMQTFSSCGSLDDYLKIAYDGGYQYESAAIEDHGFPVLLFVNRESGEFMFIAVDEEDNACRMLGGYNWQFVETKSF